MMIISFRGLGIQSEARLFGKLFASLYFGSCGKKEMQRLLRRNGDRKGCCGICFSSTLLFRPLVLSLLEELHLTLFNSISFRFVIQKFEIVGVSLRV